MRQHTTSLPGILLIEPQIFSDERGHFFGSFSQQQFCELSGAYPVQQGPRSRLAGRCGPLFLNLARPS